MKLLYFPWHGGVEAVGCVFFHQPQQARFLTFCSLKMLLLLIEDRHYFKRRCCKLPFGCGASPITVLYVAKHPGF